MSRSELTMNQARGKKGVPRASVGRRKSPRAPLRARPENERESAGMPGNNAAALGIYREFSRVENADQKEKHENA